MIRFVLFVCHCELILHFCFVVESITLCILITFFVFWIFMIVKKHNKFKIQKLNKMCWIQNVNILFQWFSRIFFRFNSKLLIKRLKYCFWICFIFIFWNYQHIFCKKKFGIWFAWFCLFFIVNYHFILFLILRFSNLIMIIFCVSILFFVLIFNFDYVFLFFAMSKRYIMCYLYICVFDFRFVFLKQKKFTNVIYAFFELFVFLYI